MADTQAQAAVTTQLSSDDIQAAKTAVNTYRATCDQLFEEIQTEITNLRAAGFIGDASNGYDTFMNAMKPTLTTQLTAPDNSATAMIDKILESVEEQLLKTVDPQLKQNNESAVGGGAEGQMA